MPLSLWKQGTKMESPLSTFFYHMDLPIHMGLSLVEDNARMMAPRNCRTRKRLVTQASFQPFNFTRTTPMSDNRWGNSSTSSDRRIPVTPQRKPFECSFESPEFHTPLSTIHGASNSCIKNKVDSPPTLPRKWCLENEYSNIIIATKA